MGCLFEIFFEIFMEGILELVVYCYIKLMSLIIPNHKITEQTFKKLKTAVTVFSAILAITLIIGLILLIQDDVFIKNIGRYMTYIPLLIIGIQIILGIIMKICFKNK